MKSLLLKIINSLIYKKNDSVFFLPLSNCETDKYDILNYSGDSVLTLINYWMYERKDVHGIIYLAVHFPDRIPLYQKYVSKFSHLKFIFIDHSSTCSLYSKTKLLYCRLRSKLWCIESVTYLQTYAVKSQFQIALSYFTSCKDNYKYQGDTIRLRKFCVSHPNSVKIISSSFLDSIIKSSAFGPNLQSFVPIGLTRNDNLNNKLPVNKACSDWIKSIKTNNNTKVILYTPTFRDYESTEEVINRSIWGEGYNDELIHNYLELNNCIVIAKLHPWQNNKVITVSGSRVFLYKKSFDFSLYDVMKLSDIMITDYSSIGMDWLLLDKPIIYNHYDYAKYREKRGFAYEPFSDFCCGEIVSSDYELIMAIDNAIMSKKNFHKKRSRLLKLMYNGRHFNVTEKVFSILEKKL